MSQAQVICLSSARGQFKQKKVQQNYLDYLKLLTDVEVENEIAFFLEHQAENLLGDHRMANRGYSLMQELAKRIDCDMMKNQVMKMAEELKTKALA